MTVQGLQGGVCFTPRIGVTLTAPRAPMYPARRRPACPRTELNYNPFALALQPYEDKCTRLRTRDAHGTCDKISWTRWAVTGDALHRQKSIHTRKCKLLRENDLTSREGSRRASGIACHTVRLCNGHCRRSPPVPVEA